MAERKPIRSEELKMTATDKTKNIVHKLNNLYKDENYEPGLASWNEAAAASVTKEEIAGQLFDLANELAGDETGHLAAIIHSVVSELQHGVDAFGMISKVQQQMVLINQLQGIKPKPNPPRNQIIKEGEQR
jgi:hypothetical protein